MAEALRQLDVEEDDRPAPTNLAPALPWTAASPRETAEARGHTFLFLTLEADRPLAGGARYLLDEVDEVVLSRGPDRTAVRTQEPEDGRRRLYLRLPGSFVPSGRVRFVRTAEDRWLVEDAGCDAGLHVNGERLRRALLHPDDVVEAGRCFFLLRTLSGRFVRGGVGDLDSRDVADQQPGFTTLEPLMARRLDELRQVARSALPLILWGETGTGKEVLARGVHALSGRRGPFVALNCGTLTKGLAESQLFGHVRGAFSGALGEAPGFVRAADGGTFLLDEIADLDQATQGAFLRVLQEREVVPVGSARPQKIDVRFIATSGVALEQRVAAGTFRGDLFARLNGFSYAASPVRCRRVDLGLLVAALLKKQGVTASDQPRVTLELAWRLTRGRWRFNVRELEQSLARGWLFADDGLIDADHLDPEPADDDPPPAVFIPPAASAPAAPPARRQLLPVDETLRQQLIERLRACEGNVAEVARSYRKARMQIHRWMKRLDIDPSAFRCPAPDRA